MGIDTAKLKEELIEKGFKPINNNENKVVLFKENTKIIIQTKNA